MTTQLSDSTTQKLITGFQVLSITVSDLARAVDFYMNVLGMETDKRYPPSDEKKGIILKAGGMLIYLEGGRSATNDPGMTANTISPTFATDSIPLRTRQSRPRMLTLWKTITRNPLILQCFV